MENARNQVEDDDESESSDDEQKIWGQEILVKPSNRKRVGYEYFISFVSIVDIMFNVYAIFVGDVSLLFNLLVLPFYCIEIYLSSVSTFYVDVFLVRHIHKVMYKYL